MIPLREKTAMLPPIIINHYHYHYHYSYSYYYYSYYCCYNYIIIISVLYHYIITMITGIMR